MARFGGQIALAASVNKVDAALSHQVHADALLLCRVVVGLVRIFHVVDFAICQAGTRTASTTVSGGSSFEDRSA